MVCIVLMEKLLELIGMISFFVVVSVILVYIEKVGFVLIKMIYILFWFMLLIRFFEFLMKFWIEYVLFNYGLLLGVLNLCCKYLRWWFINLSFIFLYRRNKFVGIWGLYFEMWVINFFIFIVGFFCVDFFR